MCLFRDPVVAYGGFHIEAPYVNESAANKAEQGTARGRRGKPGKEAPRDGPPNPPNSAEVSVQGTRHADSLKLWLALRLIGSRSLGAMVEGSMDQAAGVRSAVQGIPELELAGEHGDTSIVCFRCRYGGDEASAELQRHLLAQGIFLSFPGGQWLRLVATGTPFVWPVAKLREALRGYFALPARVPAGQCKL